MQPGGVFVASTWESMEMLPLASGVMAAVVGAPKEPPPFNPAGPLGLADPELFDGLLLDAGFELAASHNTPAKVDFQFGYPIAGDDAFKVVALPVWDRLTELEDDGTAPNAWATAKEAFHELATAYADADGNLRLKGEYRIAVATKPAP